jgi:hypothetical protein
MKYRKDLLLTDTFLLKGHLVTGGQRLSSFLNSTPKRFLEMNEVTVIDHAQGECVQIPRMQVCVDEILLAHEMEVTGDAGMRLLLAERERDEVALTVHFGRAIPLQLSGKVSRRAIDRDAPGRHDFIVVIEPRLQGLTGKAAEECAVFVKLLYVIANRNRIAFIFE